MKYRSGQFWRNPTALDEFIICSLCFEPVCKNCFISDDNSCGQCVEASTNGLQFHMNSLSASLNSAISSKSPYIRRRTKKIISNILKEISKKEV